MKSSDFNKLTAKSFNSMSDSELKSLVKGQANMANRRYQNIKTRPDTNKAGVRSVDKSGGRFSVAGKNRAELIIEAKRIQKFNKMKTGTVAGARESLLNQENALRGKSHKQVEKEAARDIAKEKKREARKAAAAKGKKLSKKARKKIEREARNQAKKQSKQFMQSVEEQYNTFSDYTQKEINDLMSGTDEITGAENDETFSLKQEEFYKQLEAMEMAQSENVFKTVSSEVDEENPFI